jgi:error-prone DNA polymerase
MIRAGSTGPSEKGERRREKDLSPARSAGLGQGAGSKGQDANAAQPLCAEKGEGRKEKDLSPARNGGREQGAWDPTLAGPPAAVPPHPSPFSFLPSPAPCSGAQRPPSPFSLLPSPSYPSPSSPPPSPFSFLPSPAPPAAPYFELHARSAFSFLRGASPPATLAAEAARLGLPGLALCDRDGVYGAPRLYGAARDHALRPLVGCELTLVDGTVLPLLVASRTGYQNLCRLITATKLEERPAHAPEPLRRERKRPCFATWEEIAPLAGGLIALTGDTEGPVLSAWRTGGPAAADAALRQLLQVFGRDRVYVEVQRHRVRGEERAVRFLRDLATAHRLPLLATGGVTHATRADRPISDVFTCLRHHTTLDAAGRLLAPNAERHLHSAAVMATRFADLPEAVAESVRLAERLEFTLRDLGYHFPDFPVPAGETMASHLRARTYAGAAERFPALNEKVRRQLDRELELIERLGFCGYFLIVWDICRWARSRGILVQGRGSAANSAVCFALAITAVDPVNHGLLFERFLSEGRVGADGRPSWPDIDLDLPSGDLRESVLQEVYSRYAPRGAGMTANVITYRGRSATRELGKVLGLPEDVSDRFSSLFHGGDFPHTLALGDQLQQAGLPVDHPRAPVMVELYQRLHGLPRHLGQHSGGMVICGGQLDQVVPLEPASMPGRVVVQWDKDDCEDLGIVKVDLLGLGMMAVIQDSLRLSQARGRPIELHSIPPDDARTYQFMQEANTIGVFQIESRAQMTTLRRFKPANFYDVAMQVAIVRPGPIVGRVVHPIINRRAGREDIVCIDPEIDEELRPILYRTYGVILFQEQMLAVAMKLAGFNGSEAEELRRAMGFHRDNERLQRVLVKLRDAMRQRGHSERIIEKVVESACSFALYGFPESHAMSFALLAYASTWLKVHRPAEFLASLLNHQPMGFYGAATLVQDARRNGLSFRPVCVLASRWECTVEADDVVRLGLGYVKNLTEKHVRSMLAAREVQPFRSLEDWLARTTFTAAERRALAAVGALNGLARHRRAALWQVEAAWSTDEPLLRSHQAEFGELAVAEEAPLPPMTRPERYQADFRGLGLTTGVHPMALVRTRLPDVWRAGDLPLARDGDQVKVAGSVICRQRPGTAKGFVFISLEDETGVANAVVRPDLFERYRLVINQESALIISGRVQNEHGVIHVKAEVITPLATTGLEVPEQASHNFC